jgi:hypothetical protein
LLICSLLFPINPAATHCYCCFDGGGGCASDDYSMVILQTTRSLTRTGVALREPHSPRQKGPSLIRCIADETSAALG